MALWNLGAIPLGNELPVNEKLVLVGLASA